MIHTWKILINFLWSLHENAVFSFIWSEYACFQASLALDLNLNFETWILNWRLVEILAMLFVFSYMLSTCLDLFFFTLALWALTLLAEAQSTLSLAVTNWNTHFHVGCALRVVPERAKSTEHNYLWHVMSPNPRSKAAKLIVRGFLCSLKHCPEEQP